MSNYWVTDNETYNTLQQLKRFVEFVANLDFATAGDKAKATQIMNQIENINKPETFKYWNITLHIFDTDIQEGKNPQPGIYWRQWSVSFEKFYLEITAKSLHSDHQLFHFGEDYNYNNYLSFTKEFAPQNERNSVDIEQFINDAINYKSYITESLNTVEIDIDIET